MKKIIVGLFVILLTIALPLVIILTATYNVLLQSDTYIQAFQKANAYERIIESADNSKLKLADILPNSEIDLTSIPASAIFSAEWLQQQIDPLLTDVVALLTIPGTDIAKVTASISLEEPKQNLAGFIPQLILKDPSIIFKDRPSIPDTLLLRDIIAARINKIKLLELDSEKERDEMYTTEKFQQSQENLYTIQSTIAGIQKIIMVLWIVIIVAIIMLWLLLHASIAKYKVVAWSFLSAALLLVVSGIVMSLASPLKKFVLVKLNNSSFTISDSFHTIITDVVAIITRQISLYYFAGAFLFFLIGSILLIIYKLVKRRLQTAV